ARELGWIMAAVGLAANPAAMRALATERIQKGPSSSRPLRHDRRHRRNRRRRTADRLAQRRIYHLMDVPPTVPAAERLASKVSACQSSQSPLRAQRDAQDRKSTRLNSSHE